MKSLLTDLRSGLILTLVLSLLLGLVYPVATWAAAQALFSHRANGSLILDASGQVRGSELLAQNFTSPKYFQPRPSAAGTGYDAANSGGTNLGPTSQKLRDNVAAAVAAYRAANQLGPDQPVPADAVTSSASGLDPHISVENALLQAPRVARARRLPLSDIQARIAAATDPRGLGLLGEPAVNVLRLNLDLDGTLHP